MKNFLCVEAWVVIIVGAAGFLVIAVEKAIWGSRHKTTLEIGQIWEWEYRADPFEEYSIVRRKVLAMKEGYVQYERTDEAAKGAIGSMREGTFRGGDAKLISTAGERLRAGKLTIGGHDPDADVVKGVSKESAEPVKVDKLIAIQVDQIQESTEIYFIEILKDDKLCRGSLKWVWDDYAADHGHLEIYVGDDEWVSPYSIPIEPKHLVVQSQEAKQ